MTRPRVVIVGAGFGGLEAARTLANEPVDVLVLDRENHHAFLPLLYQVATAGLEPESIAYPVRAILRNYPNVDFRMTEVTGVDASRMRVHVDRGDPLPYDYLILAAGSGPNFFGMEGVQQAAYTLGDIDDAMALRNHVLQCFEEAMFEEDPQRRQALVTFTVVGGGPTGVEMAGALAELQRHVLRHDFPGLDFSAVRIVLIEALDNLLPAFPPKLRDNAKHELEEMGVEVWLETMVDDATCDAVYLKDGHVLPTETVIWAAGVRARLTKQLPFETERGARVVVDGSLRVAGYDNVFVIGDMAYVTDESGKPLPQIAPVAIQQGERTAQNILGLCKGREPAQFRYKDPGIMATIGRSAAVARVFGLNITGFIAWLAWLFVHLMKLVGFRNRIVVFINWAYQYIMYERGARLIVGPRRECEPVEREQAGEKAVEVEKAAA